MANKPGDDTLAIAAPDTKFRMAPFKMSRADVTANMVKVSIKYCGMCHSDLHSVNGDWGVKPYPVCPGHEIAGVVEAVGDEVKEFKVGDRVGVGCMVDSCKECDMCKQNQEQYCLKKSTFTYDSLPTEERGYKDGTAGIPTRGGYSDRITVHKRFVFKVPDALDLKLVGPLLCAGITMYSPLNRFVKGKKDQNVGIVGFGGLGHLGVKLAKAMGATVSVFSRSKDKEGAAKELGAELVVYTDKDDIGKSASKFDLIIDTVSAPHEVDGLAGALKYDGTLCMIGLGKITTSPGPLIFARRNITGSLIGGCAETNEMLQFCTDHKVLPEVEIIPVSKCTAALDELTNGVAGTKRYVLDMATMKEFHETHKA